MNIPPPPSLLMPKITANGDKAWRQIALNPTDGSTPSISSGLALGSSLPSLFNPTLQPNDTSKMTNYSLNETTVNFETPLQSKFGHIPPPHSVISNENNLPFRVEEGPYSTHSVHTQVSPDTAIYNSRSITSPSLSVANIVPESAAFPILSEENPINLMYLHQNSSSVSTNPSFDFNKNTSEVASEVTTCPNSIHIPPVEGENVSELEIAKKRKSENTSRPSIKAQKIAKFRKKTSFVDYDNHCQIPPFNRNNKEQDMDFEQLLKTHVNAQQIPNKEQDFGKNAKLDSKRNPSLEKKKRNQRNNLKKKMNPEQPEASSEEKERPLFANFLKRISSSALVSIPSENENKSPEQTIENNNKDKCTQSKGQGKAQVKGKSALLNQKKYHKSKKGEKIFQKKSDNDTVPKQSKFKTQVCKYFKTNSCAKGALCPFSHDLKMEICLFFEAGRCAAGINCPYSHGLLPK